MYHLLRKLRFGFSVDKAKFDSAEIVLRSFYGGFGKKPQTAANQSSHELIKKIRRDLADLKLKTSGAEEGKEIERISKMFDPKGGIDLSQLQSTYQKRQQKTSTADFIFALNPQPVILQNIMSLLYGEKQKKLITKSQQGLLYILGSKGLAKSTSFMMLKYFHNLRIPYLINSCKSNSPIDSIFQKNYKFFYFQADEDFEDTIQTIQSQLKIDFPEQDFSNLYQRFSTESITSQSRTNFNPLKQFFRSIRKKYRESNITVKSIVDQCNTLYINPQQYKQHVEIWANMAQVFKKPTILVSSKNNKYLSIEQDPIIRIASGNKTGISKVIIDNLITPQQRVQYSVDCFTFQLERIGIKVSEIYNVIDSMKQFPMSTYLSCSSYISSRGLVQTDTSKQIMSKLNQNQINKYDIQNIIKNVEQLSKNAKEYKKNTQKIRQSLEVFGNASKFYKNRKEQVQELKIKVKSHSIQNNYEIKQIPKQMKYNYVQLTQLIKQKKNTNFLTEHKMTTEGIDFVNHFFQRKINNNDIRLYSCFTHQEIKKIHFEIVKKIDAHVLIVMGKYMGISYLKDMTDSVKGNSFQWLIDIILIQYNQLNLRVTINCYNESITTFNIQRSDNQLPKFNQNQKNNHWSWNDKKERGKEIQKYVNQLTSKNCCFKAKNYNVAFDFLMSKYNTNLKRLKLFFIDASTGNDQNDKINNFKNAILKNNSVFKQIFSQVAKSEQIRGIQITFIILRPPEAINTGINQFHGREVVNSMTDTDFQNKLDQICLTQLPFGQNFTFQLDDPNKRGQKIAASEVLLSNAIQAWTIFKKFEQGKQPSDQQIENLLSRIKKKMK